MGQQQPPQYPQTPRKQTDGDFVTAYTAGADKSPPAYPGQPSSVRAEQLKPYRNPKANGWAKASVVMAALGFIGPLIPSLLALTFAIVAMRKDRGSRPTQNLAVIGIVLGTIMLVWNGVVMVPAYYRYQEIDRRIHCGSNLRQIGQGLLLYAIDNHDALPDTFEAVLVTQDITPEVFVCPDSKDTPASIPPPAPGTSGKAYAQALAHAMMQPRHCSYVYLGKGLSVDERAENYASPLTVIAYESPTDHSYAGINVLWGDGHVSWVEARQAGYLIGELKNGHNPPLSMNGAN